MLDWKNDIEEESLYQSMIIIDFEKISFNINTSFMKQGPIPNNFIKYVQCKKNCTDYDKLQDRALEPKKS